MAKTDQR